MSISARPLLLGAAAVLAAALAGLAILTLSAGERSEKPMSDASEQIREIEANMGLRVPEGADLRLLLRETGGDPLIRAILVMSPAAFERMLAENNWPPEEFRPENFRLLGPDSGAWKPRARPPFPVYARPVERGRYLYVGRDAEDGRIVVYLNWFRT